MSQSYGKIGLIPYKLGLFSDVRQGKPQGYVKPATKRFFMPKRRVVPFTAGIKHFYYRFIAVSALYHNFA